MKNYIFYLLESKLSLNIKGNNVERFIKRLKSNNIEILNIKYISKNEINIKVYKKDYDKIIKLKTIYEINTLDYYGLIKYKNNILNNKFVILSILFALIGLYILSNMIFYVDVVTNDSKMEATLINDLKEYGIDKYKFKKSYEKLQEIKKEILSKHKNELEWLEIENIGTKYIIRYEPRILNNENEETPLRNIIASRDAVITDMKISSGQIIKGVNSYVKKGDIIVSGYIYLNNSVKDTVSSKGSVYGETWYNVTITYPYKYYEKTRTGNEKNVFVIKFLNKEIELFNFNKYETKDEKNNTLLKNNLLPIKFIYQKQYETNIIDENNTEEQLIEKAIEYAKNKMEENLNDNEYVSDYKVLNKIKNNDSITLNIFFNVVLDITEYQEIEEYVEIEEQINNP
ncbi:MAG: sporulation protein YqfD [Bacilli bacterium]|nr:sporulation protein YqfD [Bacilli bacterium]